MKKFIKENNEKLLLILILLVGAILRFYNITGLSLSNDELSAIARAQLSGFSNFISNGICKDIHPSGIEFFLYLWLKIFGTSVFIIRFPFVIAGIASIYFAYQIAARWFNKHTALFVATAVCVLEFPILYSQVARPFGPAFLFTLLSVWYWTKLIFDGEIKRKDILSLALSMSAAAYCNYYAALFIIIIFISGFFFLNKSNTKTYLLSLVFALVFYIPNIFVIVSQFSNKAGVNWLALPDGNWIYYHILFIFNKSKILFYFILALFIFTHITNITEIKFSKFHYLSAAWFLIPFIFTFCYSIWIKPILEDSTLFFSFIFLIFIIFSFVCEKKKKFNFYFILIFLLSGCVSTFVEKKYYSTYHFGEFKDLAAKTIEWNNEIGEKNITQAININSPYYINYYLEKAGKPLSFEMYKDEGREDIRKLNEIVLNSKTPYFLYAWSSLVDPNETSDIILAKYPYIIKQIDYNGMAAITLYSMYDSTHAIPQPKPVFYLFNGFEHKETWDKDTSIVSTEKVWKGKYSVKLDAKNEYGPTYAVRISKMTDQPFKRFYISLWAYATGKFKDAQIVATISFKDDENQVYEKYFWLSSKFSYFIEKDKWGQVFFSFNLPELMSRNDELKIYVWNPDKQPLYIDNFEMKLYQ